MSDPVTIVEIDRDICSLVYGVGPCTATGTPCYNTWATCQIKPVFAVTTQVMRFVKPRADIPMALDAIPSVRSTTTSPTELNVGDVDASSGPLGKRAQATVSFEDHPYSDALTDPYVATRSLNPFESGTFWTKLKARWPIAKGRSLRIIDGLISKKDTEIILLEQGDFLLTESGDQIVYAIYQPEVFYEVVREYLIDAIDGPNSSGIVTVRAVDPLRMLDDKTSQAPKQSTGYLSEDINNGSTQTYINVVGANISDYPASGTLRIESELITYTDRTSSNGTITFTGITRGTDGSTAKEHKAESRVQTCVRYTNQNAWEVAKSLIEIYAPSAYGYIDQAQWSAEATQWLDGFIVSGLISEPTGLNTLLAELCRDAQFFIWWDERLQKILLKAVRPPTETPVQFNEEANILAGSQSIKTAPNERVSQLWYYYEPADLSKKVDAEDNYRKVRIRIDSESEGVREYDERAVKKIYSRWVRTDSIVIAITTRIIARYRDDPLYLTISVDAKDRSTWTADVVDVSSRLQTNTEGLPLTRRYQVVSAQEVQPGAVIKYVLQTYDFTAKYAYWMAIDAPIFSLATDEEKALGAWWSDDAGLISGESGYEWQ
jgi:hypothetical protein